MKDFQTARTMVGGLKGVMTKLGDAPQHEHKWKVMPKCPFCGHKDSAGVFNQGGVDYFKCHFTSCSSGGAVLTEVGYISMREGLSDARQPHGASPAYRRFLELAGCWEEPPERKAEGRNPKTEPEKAKTNGAAAAPTAPPAVPYGLKLPPEPKPAGGLPNPVLPPEAEAKPPGETLVPLPDDELVLRGIEVIRVENKASASLLQRRLKIGFAKAERILQELEKRGMIGPVEGAANGPTGRKILKLPERAPGLVVIKIDDEITIERTTPENKADGGSKVEDGKGQAHAAPDRPGRTDGDGKKEDDKPKLPLGMAVLREYHSMLWPTETEMRPYLDAPVHFCDKCGTARVGTKKPETDLKPEKTEGWKCLKCGGLTRLIERVPDPIPEPIAKKLKFQSVAIYEKRGLTSITCAAMGLCANPPANEGMLEELGQKHPWEEKRASGLWLEADRKFKLGRRPNAQFFGKGQIGRKPEKERKHKDDKWVWGFNSPVLIPYFNEAGELEKLRPHKGGAPGGTVAGKPRIYVPRDFRHCADMVEKFYEVIICEGEYKAMAIWQTIGLGAKLQAPTDTGIAGSHVPANFEPVGVCALPGISYVKNFEMRDDLERWLQSVKVPGRKLRVIIAFDDEDKSDKPFKQRFDAQRMARVLAIKLSESIHVEARVCSLPKAWRNERGKADWDGALAMLLHRETSNIQHSTSNNQ